jgi:hypothetical protein
MNSDLKTINNTGFYFYPGYLVHQNSAWQAHVNATHRRLFSPGIAPEAIIVRYYGYTGMYNDIEFLDSQYIYHSIYDAMRQIIDYKEEECEGRIELLAYTDESGLELLREWKYEVEGFVNMDGDNEVEYAGWEIVK